MRCIFCARVLRMTSLIVTARTSWSFSQSGSLCHPKRRLRIRGDDLRVARLSCERVSLAPSALTHDRLRRLRSELRRLRSPQTGLERYQRMPMRSQSFNRMSSLAFCPSRTSGATGQRRTSMSSSGPSWAMRIGAPSSGGPRMLPIDAVRSRVGHRLHCLHAGYSSNYFCLYCLGLPFVYLCEQPGNCCACVEPLQLRLVASCWLLAYSIVTSKSLPLR